MLLEPLREEVVYLNQELPRNYLVTWTNEDASSLRTSHRHHALPTVRNHNLGFRCARSAP